MTESDGRDDGPIGSPIGTGLVTVATNRSVDTGAAGDEIVALLEEHGCEIAMREHIDNDYDTVQSVISRLVDRDDVDLIVTSGGTSIEPNDVTLEAVDPLVEKDLTAFSELFTAIAYEEFGSRTVASRARAGIVEEVPVFCLPGNRDAVRLGLEEIILPEARHLVTLAHSDALEESSGMEISVAESEENDVDE
ncbi:MogA/MoaB family molybdenum cofactor biosynthesis protein [Natronococcus wangiae]|uniref:MogA/MoaB family molybdenum cofactor biosynthesis protein n=1 Tax=Natronococcus wangiae TaxID=3068275 RepID=UPI00273EDB7B|nr:molybdopterin-binding protein [Natronococcus sp. AD5]